MGMLHLERVVAALHESCRGTSRVHDATERGQLANKANLDERIAQGINRVVLACPFYASLVSTEKASGWPFAAGANQEKCTEILKHGLGFK